MRLETFASRNRIHKGENRMCRKQLAVRAIAALVLSITIHSSLSAQALRTWVSGVGDDANPGSRTAPCKTFAGAISKTAAGGEIDCLDPGGFGAVTITKSLTIDGKGTFASILGAGTNGIIINAGVNDVITIRNLSINGAGTGLNGIRFIAGGALHIEDCVIFNFAQKGVDFQPAGASKLFIKDTVIRNNANAVNGGGVFIKPQAAGSAIASLDGLRLVGNTFGINVQTSGTVTCSDCSVSGHSGNGVVINNPASAINLFLERMVITNNGNGISSNGNVSTVRLSDSTITQNNVGLVINNSAQIISFGNNRIAGNTTNGAPSSTIAPL
jgi:hypothetical protein